MIVPAQSQNPQVKPRWVAPVGVMESVVAYNCRKYGFPRPVLAMPFWEGAGNRAIDLSGNGIHGDFYHPAWVANGLKFNGTSDYINFGLNTDLLIQDVLTIVSRVNLNSDYTTAQAVIADANMPGTLANYALLFGYNDNKFEFWNNAAGPSITSDTAISDNDVYDVAVTRDGVAGNWTLKIYLNGNLDKTAAGVAANPNAAASYQAIGRFGGYPTGYRWNGNIDWIFVFAEVLSAREIKFITDNPYFMYRMPEELYGYPPAAVGAIMNQFQKHNIGADLYNGAIIA